MTYMKRVDVLKRIIEEGIVAVIRADSKEQCKRTIEAVMAGGIKIVEITMTVPGAVEIIQEVSKSYQKDDLIIGAGTVLDPETARLCILAGSQFIVSPALNKETIRLCNRYRVPVM